MASQGMVQPVRSLPAVQETRVRPLRWEGPLEKEMAAHSSILAWEIPWTEEPDRSRTWPSDLTSLHFELEGEKEWKGEGLVDGAIRMQTTFTN